MRSTKTYSIDHHSWLKTALRVLKIALWASVGLFVLTILWSAIFGYGLLITDILIP